MAVDFVKEQSKGVRWDRVLYCHSARVFLGLLRLLLLGLGYIR